MKVFIFLLTLSSIVIADTPRKHNINKFNRLWTDSPFTTKPPEPQKQVKKNLDWSLAGLSRHSNGSYTVTLINKKDRNDRLYINTDGRNMKKRELEFEVLEVEQAKGFNFKDSKVQIQNSDGVTGWVEYDQNTLDVKPVRAQVRPSSGNRTISPRTSSSNSRSSNNVRTAPRTGQSTQQRTSPSRTPTSTRQSNSPQSNSSNSTQNITTQRIQGQDVEIITNNSAGTATNVNLNISTAGAANTSQNTSGNSTTNSTSSAPRRRPVIRRTSQ